MKNLKTREKLEKLVKTHEKLKKLVKKLKTCRFLKKTNEKIQMLEKLKTMTKQTNKERNTCAKVVRIFKHTGKHLQKFKLQTSVNISKTQETCLENWQRQQKLSKNAKNMCKFGCLFKLRFVGFTGSSLDVSVEICAQNLSRGGFAFTYLVKDDETQERHG